MTSEAIGNIKRFDNLVRSERYFSATLFPAVLFHNKLAGVAGFFELIDRRTKTERNRSGTARAPVPREHDFRDIEIITEFHIWRDLRYMNLLLDEEEPERRDAPDVVIIAGQELVVCECKFFSEFGRVELLRQLKSQRLQVRHLLSHSTQIQSYRHVAILPFSIAETEIDADVVLTWDDIRGLAEKVLGAEHYVVHRLRDAVTRYNSMQSAGSGDLNYDERLPFEQMYERCLEKPDQIWVGHKGGAPDLRSCSLVAVRHKKWKLRNRENKGTVIEQNWLPAARWLEIVDGLV